MPRPEIKPEKVTRPFQLLAAWFVALIALEGAFLGGARLIGEPPWVAGMLAVAAVAVVPIFLISMFLLQTRFRTEMQDDKYYAAYLQQRREVSETADKLTEVMSASGLNLQSLVSAQRKLSDLPQALEQEIRDLLRDLRGRLAAEKLGSVGEGPEPAPNAVLALARGLLAEEAWLEAAAEFQTYARFRPEDWEASVARGVAFANARAGVSSDLSALRAYNDAIAYAPVEGLGSLRARLFAYRGAMLKRLARLDEAEADLMLAKGYASDEYEKLDIAYNLACVYALTQRRSQMLDQIASIRGARGYLKGVRAHLDDYFRAYRDDPELLSLINEA